MTVECVGLTFARETQNIMWYFTKTGFINTGFLHLRITKMCRDLMALLQLTALREESSGACVIRPIQKLL